MGWPISWWNIITPYCLISWIVVLVIVLCVCVHCGVHFATNKIGEKKTNNIYNNWIKKNRNIVSLQVLSHIYDIVVARNATGRKPSSTGWRLKYVYINLYYLFLVTDSKCNIDIKLEWKFKLNEKTAAYKRRNELSSSFMCSYIYDNDIWRPWYIWPNFVVITFSILKHNHPHKQTYSVVSLFTVWHL